ncbi:DUF6747 family protein [Arenibacter algicola]|uniref:DUF6747 family protein n=1 Tax=Arenibacter algicola TaxID=616991 RepID=UPI00339D8EAB
MVKSIILKKVYLEAFKNLGNQLVKNGFKIYFWACAVLFILVLYAFVFRLTTGFVWD